MLHSLVDSACIHTPCVISVFLGIMGKDTFFLCIFVIPVGLF